MDNARKKDLVREYKEQKKSIGIFAVRCGDAVWVGTSTDMAKKKNSLWFQLRMSGTYNKPMEAAWKEHGEAAFTYEVLEEISDENPGMVALLLKDRDAHWRKELGAGKVQG